jgi:hypothetical protein
VSNFKRQTFSMCGYSSHSVTKMMDFFSARILGIFLCCSPIIGSHTLTAQAYQANQLKINSLKILFAALKNSTKKNCLNTINPVPILIEKGRYLVFITQTTIGSKITNRQIEILQQIKQLDPCIKITCLGMGRWQCWRNRGNTENTNHTIEYYK